MAIEIVAIPFAQNMFHLLRLPQNLVEALPLLISKFLHAPSFPHLLFEFRRSRHAFPKPTSSPAKRIAIFKRVATIALLLQAHANAALVYLRLLCERNSDVNLKFKRFTVAHGTIGSDHFDTRRIPGTKSLMGRKEIQKDKWNPKPRRAQSHEVCDAAAVKTEGIPGLDVVRCY